MRAAEDGAVVIADPSGAPLARIPRPYAIDARGVRRDGAIAVDGDRVLFHVDRAGLAFPLLVDPALETGAWAQATPTASPPPRMAASLVFDVARSKAVLFGGGGGANGSSYLNDTWTYDGTTWSPVSIASPPETRAFASMAYDSTQHRTILFGGADCPGANCTTLIHLNDTWSFDGTTWTKLSPTASPQTRAYAAMTYDSARQRVVLFGGLIDDPVNGTGLDSDVWEFDGTTWTFRGDQGPDVRKNAALVYDSARQKTVLFGGQALGANNVAYYAKDTWEWDGNGWTRINTATSPSGREAPAAVYDVNRQRVVLFGGFTNNGNTPINDTWEYDGTDWTKVATSSSPTLRIVAPMGYDSKRLRTVLFGGLVSSGGSSSVLQETWEYHRHGASCASDAQCETGHCIDGSAAIRCAARVRRATSRARSGRAPR